jgi:hypothetical protein
MEHLMGLFRKIVFQVTFFPLHHGKGLKSPTITIILIVPQEDIEIAFKECHNLRQH